MEKTCGICLDVVSLFGMLPNCQHSFCFSCIKEWRQKMEFAYEVRKGCPECRIISHFVYQSKCFLEVESEKEKYITEENRKMKRRHCKYFRRGRGICPFGETCVFKHSKASGVGEREKSAIFRSTFSQSRNEIFMQYLRSFLDAEWSSDYDSDSD